MNPDFREMGESKEKVKETKNQIVYNEITKQWYKVIDNEFKAFTPQEHSIIFDLIGTMHIEHNLMDMLDVIKARFAEPKYKLLTVAVDLENSLIICQLLGDCLGQNSVTTKIDIEFGFLTDETLAFLSIITNNNQDELTDIQLSNLLYHNTTDFEVVKTLNIDKI